MSACAEHREWIEAQLKLGRNATSIYQDLVELYGFDHAYNSVKRFVAKLRIRDPERFDVLEFLPGEGAQVDFGKGALTLHRGRYRRPWLFVMTLKYSGKSYRVCVWKADQETWARLHEEAFHAFGGRPQYAVIDNLKAGVLEPDIYEPTLNPVYAALLAHYGVVADPCRIADPNRKGTVESAIQHTQATALKGRRFESLQAQNTWLAHWEERWAAPRIHGRKKRQVLEMFVEEKVALRPLPATRFRYFRQGLRTVDDAGLVQVDASYYAALPSPPHSEVTVRIYDHEIEIFDLAGQQLRRHETSTRKGTFVLDSGDRLFNPSRETGRLLSKAEQIGPHTAAFAQQLFADRGRPGQRALYGLTNLVRTYTRAEVETVCARLLAGQCHVLELATLKFIDAREDVLVIGPPGTGKSHVAKALACSAVLRGYKVLYREAHQLIEDITEARELGELRKLRTHLRGADLLLVDDLFLRKLPAHAGDELADVLMARYEKASTIITSNRPLDDWTRLLGTSSSSLRSSTGSCTTATCCPSRARAGD